MTNKKDENIICVLCLYYNDLENFLGKIGRRLGRCTNKKEKEHYLHILTYDHPKCRNYISDKTVY